jgi:hypothetical protein
LIDEGQVTLPLLSVQTPENKASFVAGYWSANRPLCPLASMARCAQTRSSSEEAILREARDKAKQSRSSNTAARLIADHFFNGSRGLSTPVFRLLLEAPIRHKSLEIDGIPTVDQRSSQIFPFTLRIR